MRRRVAELALGLADDTVQGIKALSQLESPEKDELSELAELYLEAGAIRETLRYTSGAKRRRSRDAS